MKIGNDWLFVARRAWSFRLTVVAVVLSAAEVLIQIAPGFIPAPPVPFAAMSGVVSIAALYARLAIQKGFNDA
jgi:hypothetical protein